VLRNVARCLQSNLRRTDAIGRYGGEEFVFFLSEVEIEEGVRISDKLREFVAGLEVPIADLQPPLRVTVSIGIAGWRGEDETLTAAILVERADRASTGRKPAGGIAWKLKGHERGSRRRNRIPRSRNLRMTGRRRFTEAELSRQLRIDPKTLQPKLRRFSLKTR